VPDRLRLYSVACVPVAKPKDLRMEVLT